MSGYTEFAAFYDRLQEINYGDYTDGLIRIWNHYRHVPDLVLDLACGTGGFAIEICKRGIEVIGVDASAEMLMRASEKAEAAGLDILFLCQRAERLDLYGTVDTCICMLDSINHICDYKDLDRAFSRVSLFLETDGIFVFDVNTVYKHREILGNHTFVLENNNLYCVWRNAYNPSDQTVEITLDFFSGQDGRYARTVERFTERAYSAQEIRQLAIKNGFKILDIYGEKPFQGTSPKDERRIYVLKKI